MPAACYSYVQRLSDEQLEGVPNAPQPRTPEHYLSRRQHNLDVPAHADRRRP